MNRVFSVVPSRMFFPSFGLDESSPYTERGSSRPGATSEWFSCEKGADS